MARPHVQFCLPKSLHQQVLSFKAEHSLSDTEAMVRMIEAFFGVQPHCQFKQAELPTEGEHIPVSKKKKGHWQPLSEHTKARRQVYRCLDSYLDGATSSDIAHQTGQMTGNVAKRLQELRQEGYIEATGKYRMSRDSRKMLTLWRRTAKVYEVPK